MNLSTVDRYLALFPETKTASAVPGQVRTQLEMALAGTSACFENYLRRHVASAERTEKFPVEDGTGTKLVRLKGYPVASIFALTAWDVSYSAADGDYALDPDTGEIEFAFPVLRDGDLISSGISVTYTGGMAEDTDDFIAKFPEIETAFLRQVNFEITRQTSLTRRSLSINGATEGLNPFGLMDATIAVLSRYRREAVP